MDILRKKTYYEFNSNLVGEVVRYKINQWSEPKTGIVNRVSGKAIYITYGAGEDTMFDTDINSNGGRINLIKVEEVCK